MMDASGPYRTAAGDACPGCATPLAASERGALRACPKGCGEWAVAAFVDEHWGDVVDVQHDARLRWRHPKRELACIACGAPMRKVVNLDWVAHRCRDHGVWFEGEGAFAFERAEATAIAEHVRERGLILALAASLRDASVARPAALIDFARRMRALERQVVQLEAEVDRLRRTRL